MTTRSAVLAAGLLVGKPSGVIYSCASNRVTLVKSAYLQNQTGTPNVLSFYMSRPSQGITVTLASIDAPAWGFVSWDGWFVLEPLDELLMSFDQGPVFYWVSGALLPLPTS